MELQPINLVDGGEENSQQDSKSESTGMLKRRREEIAIWDYFDKKVDPKTNTLKAYCKACSMSCSIGETECNHGTGNLNDGELPSRKFSQAVYREKMAEAIMYHNYPFSIVEHEKLREFQRYLNPDVEPYTRNEAKMDCLRIYNREMDKLKEVFQKIPGRICLTSNVWSSITTEDYISLTAHFVDHEYALHSRIINFRLIPFPHTGIILAEEVLGFLKDWGIEKKIFSLTLEDASANDSMQDYLRAQLGESLLCSGKFFHVRCSAQILNLIVQDVLEISNEAIYKIRESVQYVKGYESRLTKFTSCCEQLNLPVSLGLRLDYVTRWDSTWDMLDCNIQYREAFFQYSLLEPEYTSCPSQEEWDLVQVITSFLRPFRKITNLFSESSYPTANMYFLYFSRIHELLIEKLTCEIESVRNMAHVMLSKFKKHWDDCYVILSMAIILDPRCKVELVKFQLKKIETDENVVDTKVNQILSEMKLLYSEYVLENTRSQAQVEDDTSSMDMRNDYDDYVKEFLMEIQNSSTDSTESELELYLEERLLPPKDSFDVLQEWRKLSYRYPILAKMALDILSIPITTVASESAFSIGAKVLNESRSWVQPTNAEALICGRNWIGGYHIEDDELSDEEELIVPLVKNQELGGSNVAETAT